MIKIAKKDIGKQRKQFQGVYRMSIFMV